MKINTDFTHPDDQTLLIKESQKPFLAKDVSLNVPSFENAEIHPGWLEGGVWLNGERLPHTWLHNDFAGENPKDDVLIPSPPPNFCNEEVVYVGIHSGCWGHELTDHLKHLWFYFDARFAHLKNLKFVYTFLFPNLLPSANFFELIQSIGITKEKFHLVDNATRFKRIYVPDECFFYDLKLNYRRYTSEYLNLFLRLPDLPKPKNLNVEKIYFSRVALHSNKDFNEKEIEFFFKKQGFTIIYPEQNTFLENLAILQHCGIFAATDGSIAHNVIFCKRAKQMLLLRKCRQFTIYQAVAQTIASEFNPNIEIFYIDAAYSPIADKRYGWWGGPFFLYESNSLRRFFNLPPKIFPFFKYAKFLFFWYRSQWQKKSPAQKEHFLLGWTHPIRAKLQIGTRLRRFFKKS